ncbi:MAG: Flp family type IVb pilin [Rhodospirillaceae bacterium]|nr:Flp family type IVb pilin [Rhodospirillaceae bacterium]
MFKRFLRSSSAATAVEYALLAGLISIAIIVAVSAIGSETNGLWGVVSSQVSGAINSVM